MLRTLFPLMILAVGGVNLPVHGQNEDPTTHYVAQVAAGEDEANNTFFPIFYLVNLTDQPVTGEVVARAEDGNLMPIFKVGNLFNPVASIAFELGPLGMQRIGTEGAPLPVVQLGWTRITASAPIGVIVTLHYRGCCGTAGEILTSTSILPDPIAESFTTLGLITDESRTGLALANLSETETAEITIRLFDEAGLKVMEKATSLPPLNKVAQFLDEDYFFPDLEFFQGSVEVSSTLPLAATVIRVDGIIWSAFRIFPERP